jgi:hypothetical protein
MRCGKGPSTYFESPQSSDRYATASLTRNHASGLPILASPFFAPSLPSDAYFLGKREIVFFAFASAAHFPHVRLT